MMRKRTLLATAVVALCSLLLAACGPSAEQANREAAAFCEPHGGVKQIEYLQANFPSLDAAYKATCRDGSETK